MLLRCYFVRAVTCRFAWRSMGAIGFCLLISLVGCSSRTVQIDLVPTHQRIGPKMVHRSNAWFISNRVAIVNISGMLTDSREGRLLGSGHNPVSDLKEALHAIKHDPRVKAVILRLNTPGGTVTASAMMYHDILAFKRKAHRPVIASMMDVCASGGYYVSCAADYQMAYPTTITGSIGVIVQLFNFHQSLQFLRISAPVFVSGPNKETGSPFSRMTPAQARIIQGFVNQFFARFKGIVEKTHPDVAKADWARLTDGRPLTGQDAARYHLINSVGSLQDAITMAKRLAHIRHANVVLYSRGSHGSGSIYATAHPVKPMGNVNLLNLNLGSAEMASLLHPQFLYMWEN